VGEQEDGCAFGLGHGFDHPIPASPTPCTSVIKYIF
jgi:hypothetical protein